MNSTNIFNEAERKAVENAIHDAEGQTSAEIVCAVATESGRYDRAEAVGGITLALIFLGLANLSTLTSGPGDWGGAAPSFGIQCVAVVIGFVGGNVLLSYVHSLRQFFTSRSQMDQEVERAAHGIFAARGLHRTSGRGGVLIYLSLYERQIYVLADEGAMGAGGKDLPESIRLATNGPLQSRDFSGALLAGIAQTVNLVKAKLPKQPGDQNELPNEVEIFHPRF